MIVLLDTNVLGILCNPNKKQEMIECQIWFERLLARGVYFATSELCDYELRRGLMLAQQVGKSADGLTILERLRELIDFLKVDYQVTLEASNIWVKSRLTGQPTADEKNIDIDIIISAHWQILQRMFPGRYVVVSTTNVKHLSLFSQAEEWQNISY